MGGANVNTPRIDAHMHLFAPQGDRFRRGVNDLYPPERSALVGEYLETMDSNGIDHSVIVSLDEHDDYTREVVMAFPERFSAVAVMDLSHPEPVEDFRSRIATMPLVGYRIWELGVVDAPVTELRYFGLLKEMSERGVAAWFYSSLEQLAVLPRVLEELPNLQVVLNHLGFCQSGIGTDEWGRPRISVDVPPASLQLVRALADFPTVAVHFSGHYAFSNAPYPYMDLAEVSTELFDAFGADRLLWGSDWPWIIEHPGYSAVVGMVEQHLPNLSSEERDMILGGNAARILRIGER
jgi:predicted TIM-barrel fold metal-dependent hydrolase